MVFEALCGFGPLWKDIMDIFAAAIHGRIFIFFLRL
jgi:hypothetical protein